MSYNTFITNKIRSIVRKVGGEIIPIMTSFSGWPDRLIVLPGGRVIWLEIKTNKDTLSPAQKHIIDKLTSLGHKVVVLRQTEQDIYIEDIKKML